MANNTKYTILAAYASLIRQKHIDKVTVKDVVEVCGITRQTFYYHFQDLLDVIEWGLRKKAEEAAQQGMEAKSMEEVLYTYLRTADENRQLSRKILNSQKKTQMFEIIFQSTQSGLFGLLKERSQSCDISVHELDFAVHFYAYALTGVMYDVVLNDSADLDAYVKQMAELMEPLLSKLQL